MNNESIHDGLDKKEIRDFLSKNLQEVDGVNSVEFLENEIKNLQERLGKAKKFRVIKEIVEMNEWKIFDVSDIVPYDKDKYFDFIGTDDEFDNIFGKVTK